MRYGAVIIDSRKTQTEIDLIWWRHNVFLPKGTQAIYSKIPISNISEYNKAVTSIEFWQSLPFDKVLIFQHDSGLLRTGIEEFLEYDFIGAPLYHIPMPAMNGGLSLRTVKAMIECIKNTPYNSQIHGNEDIYFCNQLKKLGYNLPTKEVAQKFSVETIYGLGSLGYHAIDKWHSKEKCETILNQYK